MKKKSFIVYESTVYPGATENYCLPILEKKSKLKLNSYFRTQLDYVVPGMLGKSSNPTSIKHLQTGAVLR